MELDDFVSVLEKAPFFSVCDEEQLRLIAFASEKRSVRAGESLFAKGMPADGAYVLISGMVRVLGDESGSAKGRLVEDRGTVIGELGLMLDRPRRARVKAVTDAQLLFVPRTAFTRLLQQYPDLAARVADQLQGDLDSFLGAVARFSRKGRA